MCASNSSGVPQPPKRLSGRPWQRIRAYILHRDGYVCAKCGGGAVLHVDHIVPVSEGGGNEPENLRVLCEGCNLARRSQSRRAKRKPEGPQREAWRRFAREGDRP